MAALWNSNLLRIVLYLVLGALALYARRRERSRATASDGVWAPFWWLTAGFLVTLALGRAGDIGSLISELGRGRAVDEGWYGSRRPLQTAVVVGLGGAWFVTVSIACWKTPERRRRYLPVGLMVVTLAAYGAIRVVSLHQVDAVLYRPEIGGARLATVIEVALQVVTAIATAWVPPSRLHDAPSDERDAARLAPQ